MVNRLNIIGFYLWFTWVTHKYEYIIKVSQYLGVFNKYSIQLHIFNNP